MAAPERRVALVTGGGGFIGARVHAPLRERGFEIVAPSSKEADLLVAGVAERLIETVRPTHLLHLAWCTEHGSYWDAADNHDWVTATRRLIDAFRGAGGKRAVTAGTCAEYDWSAGGVFTEGETLERPATLYGASKLAISRLADAHGRVFFLFGPDEHPERLVASVTRKLLDGEPALTSPGEQRRDFLHVDDVGRAFAAILDSDLAGPVNIGSGEATMVADLVRMIGDVTGRPELLRIAALPARPGEPAEITADPGLLRGLGFRTSMCLREALATNAALTKRAMQG